MNGFIKQIAAGLCFGAALIAMAGCTHYREIVDPCWPARYNSMARGSVREMSNAQADKGHLLEQTIWNADFETNKMSKEPTQLNAAGMERLAYIARRQPAPDFHLYLQFAHDVKEDKREAVTNARRAAIRSFLTANTKVGNGDLYQIDVHDFVQPTYPAEWTEEAMKKVKANTSSGTFQNFPSTGTSSK